MTGHDLRTIRTGLGLGAVSFARALGYTGTRASLDTTMRRLELGVRPIPPAIARLADMYGRHGVPQSAVEPDRAV